MPCLAILIVTLLLSIALSLSQITRNTAKRLGHADRREADDLRWANVMPINSNYVPITKTQYAVNKFNRK